jgi:dipeptidyl aminopeptidase/acylaminoacyl peptidase
MCEKSHEFHTSPRFAPANSSTSFRPGLGETPVKLSLLMGAMLALMSAWPAATAPLETYGKLPYVETMSLSPDGHKLAYAVTDDGEQRKIIVKNLDTGAIIGGIVAGTHKIRGIEWAGPNNLIILNSVTTSIDSSSTWEWFLAFDYNILKKRILPLLSNVNAGSTHEGNLNVVYGWREIRFLNGHPFAFARGEEVVGNGGRVGLFRVDLDNADVADVAFEGFENTVSYAVNAKGKPLAESEYDGKRGVWTLRLLTDHPREVRRVVAPIETPALLGLGKDGESLLVGFFGEKGYTMQELSPTSDTWSDPIPQPDELIWDTATYRLIGDYRLVEDEARYNFYNARDQAIWKAVTAAYPGSRVTLVSFSDDHRKVVVLVSSPEEGEAYALVDLDKHSGTWLAPRYKGLKPEDISPVQAIKFKAADGVDLTGYLTLPRGRPAKGLPLVVFPHGGPAARDEPGFDWWTQAMASRGYAVLQVNYRGSDGFGWDFMSAGFGQWGRKMQTDLSDGVRHLAAAGTIDPARVCIVGASYGGYAALAGAAIDTGVYRCAASVAGLADLKRFLLAKKDSEGDEGAGTQKYWLRFMGPQSGLDELSPAKQVEKITIPVLLIHGKDDTVVPFEQSQIMADALKKAGKPVEFVTLNKEDHWLSQGATRLLMLQSVMAFLEKNNPPT